MKKILSVILAVFFTLGFSACAPAPAGIDWEVDKPWGKKYEKCVYDINLTERVISDGVMIDGEIIAAGKLTYELNIVTQNNTNYADLIMDFVLTYKNTDKAGKNKGLTDTVASRVRFANDGMGAVHSAKTIILAPRKGTDGKYEDTNSYQVTADYNTLKASAQKGRLVNADGETDAGYKEMKEFALLDKAATFDNEQLFYVLRALSTVKIGATLSINNSNIYEISSSIKPNGKYEPVKMTASVAQDLTVKTLNPSFAKNYLKKAESGNYDVSCMTVTLSKSVSPTGAPIYLYITDAGVTFTHNETYTKTNKVIVGMKQIQYDLTTKKEASHLNYTLSDYETFKI